MFANMQMGFDVALAPVNLLYCFIGVSLGTFIGVLPGIGSLAAVSMLLPITFYLEPATALVMLAGVYYGAEFGGSTAAILLNLPGTPASAVTCLDGYPMARSGRAGQALFITAAASFAGGTLGILLITASAPILAEMALMFGPGDYFLVMLFGLVAAATIAQGSQLKGLAMVLVGLLLGCVGIDASSGMTRFAFGTPELYEGISLVAVAMGLFGIAEVIASVTAAGSAKERPNITFRSMLPERREMRRSALPMLRGASIGGFLGALPGTGQMVASFMSYSLEKQVAADPRRFGRGAVEGIAAPEAANNAAVQAAFIPTLTLGVPGSAPMALLLGALMIHGIVPGPEMLGAHRDVFWGLVASFWIGNVLLLILNIPLIGLWVRLLHIPYRFLFPCIVALICISVYGINNNVFDVGVMLAFGVAGYAMRLGGFEPAPLLIGFVLGPLMEENLRRGLLLAQGDFVTMMATPVGMVLSAMLLAVLGWTVWSALRGGTAAPPGAENEAVLAEQDGGVPKRKS